MVGFIIGLLFGLAGGLSVAVYVFQDLTEDRS